jgi:hypothetical protein
LDKQRKKESWYFKLEDRILCKRLTEFPVVSGQLPTRMFANGTTLLSRETNHGSFGEGFRVVTGEHRVSSRLGFEMGFNHFKSNSKHGRNR